MKKLSIIIPCYNEKQTIKELLSRVFSADYDFWQREVIIIDDCSKDGTAEILKEYETRAKVLYQEKNMGKGAAVKCGLAHASGDYLIIQDADLEYNPHEIKSLLQRIDHEKQNAVYGSRNLYHVKRRGFYIPRLGVWLITRLMNGAYGLSLTDVWTGYKLFPRASAKHFKGGGFESEILFTCDLVTAGFMITEAPISHTPRTKEEGKKIRYRDGFKAILGILSHKLLHLSKPNNHMVGDFGSLLACPKCRSPLRREKGHYVCEKERKAYRIDDFNRPFLIENAVFEENSESHVSGINWLKSFLKQFPKLYYFVWHLVCPVLMLKNGPRKILNFVSEGAVVIDVGSGPERLGKEFINLDVFPFPEVDIVGDATTLPFKDGSADAIVTESLFEHVPDASKAAVEILRVLKPGGVFYISAPFIHPYHASPDDFNRWTISGLAHLFPDAVILEKGVRSGPWSAFLMFLAYFLGVVFSFGFRKFAPFLAHIFMIVLGPLKYLDFLFMSLPGSDAVAAHLYIIGRK